MQKRTLILAGNVDSRDSHRVARKCAGTGAVAVCLDKNVSIQRLPRHTQCFHLHVATPALSVKLSRLP